MRQNVPNEKHKDSSNILYRKEEDHLCGLSVDKSAVAGEKDVK